MTEIVSQSRALLAATALKRDLALRGRTGQLVIWSSSFARAYIYNGEWVADCPQDGCTNVEFVENKRDQDRGVAGTRGERKDVYFCSYCKAMATSIHFPPDADELLEVLERRPMPHTRNWYPEGHLTALKFGIKDGETVAELLAENAEHGID
jgi:hypothetical protein